MESILIITEIAMMIISAFTFLYALIRGIGKKLFIFILILLVIQVGVFLALRFGNFCHTSSYSHCSQAYRCEEAGKDGKSKCYYLDEEDKEQVTYCNVDKGDSDERK